MADTVETAIYKLRVEGQAEIDRLTKSVDGLAVAEEKASASTRTFSQSLQNQVARIDPLVRAQEQYRKALEVNARYRESGAGTESQLTAQLAAATQNYQRQVAAIQAVEKASVSHTNAVKMQRHELINLGRQFQDVGVSLIGGQGLFTILAQQGSQIVDVFASSQAGVRGFFSQAIGWAGRFLTSTAGIVTGIGAIAAAAIYAATQFARASTTIEQALEEQNRLLKEGKALLDARTSAQDRAQLQSKEQTQFETLQNQLDLQIKLNKAMEDAAALSRRRATTPTEVPGEMGVAPTAFAARSDPGLDKMTDALVELNKAQAAGLPGLKQYNAELAKIGLAHPELALVVQDMIKAGEAGIQLENAALRAKAMSDALAGIATNAQMAAVGLGSIAQFQVNNVRAQEAAEATERQAVATLRIAQAYPGITIETAKQLQQLQNELPVLEAITGKQKMMAEYARDYANAIDQGKTELEAAALAAARLEASQVQATTSVKQQVEALKDSTEMIRAQQNGTEATTAAAQAYRNAIKSGADATAAAALSAATLENRMAGAANYAARYADNLMGAAYDRSGAGTYPAGSQSSYTQPGAGTDGSNMNFFSSPGQMSGGTFSPNPLYSSYYRGGGTGRVLDVGQGSTFWNNAQLGAGGAFGATNSWAEARFAEAKSRGDLTDSIDKLKESTDDLNATNQELLSPYYTMDPRTSHIGFRSQGMASGGYVDVPGGISMNDNMVAEVPVASGERIYVDPMTSRRGGAGGTVINISAPMTFAGNVNADEVGRTVYQTMQATARQIRAAQR